ncbi:hypothetical protein IMG5_031280, partial [Ichthyophthirius multifiliis]
KNIYFSTQYNILKKAIFYHLIYFLKNTQKVLLMTKSLIKVINFLFFLQFSNYFQLKFHIKDIKKNLKKPQIHKSFKSEISNYQKNQKFNIIKYLIIENLRF